jgi:hypothetical protein
VRDSPERLRVDTPDEADRARPNKQSNIVAGHFTFILRRIHLVLNLIRTPASLSGAVGVVDARNGNPVRGSPLSPPHTC